MAVFCTACGTGLPAGARFCSNCGAVISGVQPMPGRPLMRPRVGRQIAGVCLALALAYGFTLPAMLNHYPGRLEVVLQTLGAFNLLLFGVCAWFTWVAKGKTAGKVAG